MMKRTKTPATSKSATTKRKLQLSASQEFQQQGQTKRINKVSATLNTTIDSGVQKWVVYCLIIVYRPNNTQILDSANTQQ